MNATRLTLMTGLTTFAIGASAAWACPTCGEGATPQVKEVPTCQTDFDGDGRTGAGDLTLMLNAWGSCSSRATLDKHLDAKGEFRPAPCPSDVTGDGFVGSADLFALIAQWGQCVIVKADSPEAPSVGDNRP